MISTFNEKISFSSGFVHNKNYEMAMNTTKEFVARDNLESKMYAYQYVNALQTLRDDGKDDIYAVKDSVNGLKLEKNGKTVKQTEGKPTGLKIMNLISGYVQKDLKQPIHKKTETDLSALLDIASIKNNMTTVYQNIAEIQRKLELSEKKENERLKSSMADRLERLDKTV